MNGAANSLGMHRILCRNGLDQALFFFVQGVLRGNPAIQVTEAIHDFCTTFEIANDTSTMKTKYYRLLKEYLDDAATLKQNLATNTI